MLSLRHLAELVEAHREEIDRPVRSFAVGGQEPLPENRPALMGVVNLSPDSWYRESVCLSAQVAIQRGRVLHAQGAAVIDIGAESTLAHAARADGSLQNSRLLPVVQALHQAGVPVSVETYQPAVARACLQAGASVLNLTGYSEADLLFQLAAEHDAAVILCHVQGDNVREVGDFRSGGDAVGMMYDYFAPLVEQAQRAGAEKLFLDPGLGFYYRNLQDSSVRVRHQMEVFLNTFRLRRLGFPICHALPHAFEFFGEEVRCAEPFFAVLAALGQTSLFRTHEVARTKAVLETLGCW
ncbi:MAG: dihydropteroate synthase [Verrucomicrobiales bacterium]|nr:dihydropteroate synthase [Verrucomicrobiales bacterium]